VSRMPARASRRRTPHRQDGIPDGPPLPFKGGARHPLGASPAAPAPSAAEARGAGESAKGRWRPPYGTFPSVSRSKQPEAMTARCLLRNSTPTPRNQSEAVILSRAARRTFLSRESCLSDSRVGTRRRRISAQAPPRSLRTNRLDRRVSVSHNHPKRTAYAQLFSCIACQESHRPSLPAIPAN
jgi:hypothetical protein